MYNIYIYNCIYYVCVYYTYQRLYFKPNNKYNKTRPQDIDTDIRPRY